MTREEAIAYGNDYYRDLISACCEIGEKHKEFVRMSLEALEQESINNVLDKIKADVIARDRNVKTVRIDGRCLFTAVEVLLIIDKYREGNKE